MTFATSTENLLSAFEKRVFGVLNRYAEPPLRRGVASHGLAPMGIVVLEALGRHTGIVRRTPLVTSRVGDHFVVSTFRGRRSQWLRNLATLGDGALWVGGRRIPVRASVIHGDSQDEARSIPAALRTVLLPLTRVGWAFAVLSPNRQA